MVSLRKIAESDGMRWSNVKRGLESTEGKRVGDTALAGLLVNLLNGNFIAKSNNGTYSIADPVLAHALQSGLVK